MVVEPSGPDGPPAAPGTSVGRGAMGSVNDGAVPASERKPSRGRGAFADGASALSLPAGERGAPAVVGSLMPALAANETVDGVAPPPAAVDTAKPVRPLGAWRAAPTLSLAPTGLPTALAAARAAAGLGLVAPGTAGGLMPPSGAGALTVSGVKGVVDAPWESSFTADAMPASAWVGVWGAVPFAVGAVGAAGADASNGMPTASACRLVAVGGGVAVLAAWGVGVPPCAG